MKVKGFRFLFVCLFTLALPIGGYANAKCPSNVVIVNIPAFLASGEETWVHSFLVVQDKNGQPNLNRVLGDKFFFVQAPILTESENSRRINLGFLHLHCGRENFVFLADVMITKVTRKFLPNLGAGAKLILASKEDGEFIPRVQLWTPDGLIREYQFLNSDGPVSQNLLEELFGQSEKFWTEALWWLEILTPARPPQFCIEPINSELFAILNSPSGEFTKAEELVIGSEISKRSLITNVTLPDLVIYRYLHWGISWEVLGLGQSLKIENSSGFVFFDKPALVSKIRTLPPPEPMPN